MNPERRRLGRLVWVGGILSFAVVVSAVVASFVLYGRTIELLTNNLRERLLSISITEAANISPDALNELRVEDDWRKPQWSQIVHALKRAKDSNPNIVFMYIFRQTASSSSEMEFVADAESINPYANTDGDLTNDVDANKDGNIDPEGADKLQWPGQPYPEAVDIPEAFIAYDGPITVKDLYDDSYGRVLTGYSPIRNADGSVAAILATDIKAEDFFTVTRQTLYPFIVFIAFLTSMIAILATILIYSWHRRAAILESLSHELEIANRQQENLLHFISHEVKEYFSESEAGFAAIAEGDYEGTPPKLREMAQSALASVRRGVRTTMEILDAANLKKGTVGYKMQRFDLKESVSRTSNHLKRWADEKNLTVDIAIDEGDYSMQGDEEKIRQHVVRNLIDNAIKYTPRGKIEIRLSSRDKLRLSVKDSGVGITPEDMSNLFTEGGHGKDSIKVNVHSTGYGLFIAKQVVDAHGGKIWAESEGQGKGSTFFVEFPSA